MHPGAESLRILPVGLASGSIKQDGYRDFCCSATVRSRNKRKSRCRPVDLTMVKSEDSRPGLLTGRTLAVPR